MPDNDSNLPPGFVIQGAEPSSASGIPASGLPPGFVIQNPGPSQQPISSPQPPSSLPPGFGVQNSPNNGQPAETQKSPEDENQPWYKRVGDFIGTPLVDFEHAMSPEGSIGKAFGRTSEAGGFERGAENIVSGFTAPLSIALTLGTFGTGGLLESAGMTALKASGEFGAEELPQILKAAQTAVDAYKAAPESAMAIADAVKTAGVDPALWNRAQSFLYDHGLSEHDLLGGNLMERGAFQILHKVAPDLPVAATVRAAKTANTMLNAGFTYQQLESASAMSPRFLDALKEGDYDKAMEYGTEVFASGTLGILGASHALHSAGELFKPLIENDAFRPNDHWLQIDRANKEREAQHAVAEQEAINLDRATREILGHADPGFLETVFGGSEEAKNRKNLELATVFHNVVTGGDRVKAAQWYNTLSEALGKEDRLPVPGESGPNNGQPPIGQVNVESAPGAEFAESLPGYAKATPEEKATYHQEKMQIVKDALRASGFQIVGEDTGHGYWGGASNPVTGFHVAGDPATIESAAKLVHQVLGDQNSIGYTIPRGPSLEGNELEFNFEHPLTAEEVSKIGKNLDESGVSAYPEASDPRRLRIINYSGEHSAPNYTKGIVGLVHDALPGRPLSPIVNQTESNLVEQGTPGPIAEKARQAVGELNREHGFNRALGTEVSPPTRAGTEVVGQPNDAGEVRRGADGRPVVWLTPEAWADFRKANDLPPIKGASFSPADAEKISGNLSKNKQIQDLFDTARKTSPQGLLTTGRNNVDVQVASEEIHHTWQRELSQDGEIANLFKPGQWKKLYDIIPLDWQKKMDADAYREDPVVRVAETAAQFRSGKAAGIIPDTDIVRFLDAFYNEIESTHGKNAVEAADKINDIAAQHIKDINENRRERSTAEASELANKDADRRKLSSMEARRQAGTPKVGSGEPQEGLASREEEQEYSKLSRLRLRGGMGDPGSAGLITGDNEVFVGRYHDDLAKEAGYKLPDNGRGNLHDMFFRDGGVRIRGAGGVIHIDFMDPNADTWDRVYQAVQSVPDANRYFVDFRPIKNGTGFNIDAYDKDSLLFRLKDLEEGKERPAAPGSVAYFRNGMFSREGDYRDKEPRYPGLRPNGSRTWEEIKPYLNDEILKHDTPEKQEALTTAFNSLTDHQEYVEAIKAGRAGQMWYERSSRAFDALMDAGIDSLTKKDKPKFLNFVAALSPVQPVRSNLLMAINLWGKWDKAGRPTDVEWKDGVANKNASLYRILKGRGNTQGVDLPARMNNAIRALQGEPLSGPKVSAFTTNLGNDANRVTNDTWMAVFGGQDPNRINKPAVYDAMSAKVREAADATGIAPRQAQAAVWSFIKSLAELSGWGNDRWIPPQEIIRQGLLTPELVGMHSADFADLIQNDPEIRDAIKSIGGDLNVLDKKLKTYVPGKPAEGGPAEPNPQLLNAAERLEGARRDARVANHLARKSGPPSLFDTEFSPNNGLFSRERAPEEAKEEYDKLQNKILDRWDELDKEAASKGIKYYFPDTANLLKSSVYEGPSVSEEEVKKIAGGYHELSTHNQQAKEVLKAMQAGDSFRQAIQKYGSISLAERFGGKMGFDGPIPPEYHLYPKDFLDLTHQRDEIGAEQLRRSLSDISGRLEKTGLDSKEIDRVMDYYALNPKKTDVYAQHLAAQHTQGILDQDLRHQLGQIYSRLAIQRNIPIDDEDDYFRDAKTTEDAKKALKAVVSYFHPELENRPLLTSSKGLFAKDPQLAHQIDTNVFKNQPKDYQDLVMDSLRRNAMGELSDREIQASKRLKDEQDRNYEIGSSNDLLHHYIEDYMTRVYKDTNPAGNAILSDAKGGKFATNVTMAKQRVYDSNLTALLKSPKQMLLDPVSITARGRASLIKAAANRQLIDNLRDKFTRASDGRPAVVLSGSGQVVSGQNGEDPSIFVDPNRVRKINIDPKVIEQMSASGDLDKYLANGTLRDITPYVRPNNIGAAVDRLEEQAGRSTPIPDEHGQNPLRTQIMLLKSMQANGDFRGLKDFNDALTKKYAWDPQDYVSLANNAMKGWNFITNSPDGTPVYVRSDIKVHPEFAEYLQNRLGLKESDIAKNPVGKALLGAGSKLKHTLLSLSPFHMVQEALRGIMVGVNPFHITGPDILTGEKIDPSDPNSPTIIYKATENGFTPGTDYKSLQANSEGLSSGGGILDKIPGVGKVIGNSLNWYQDFLFKRYIPALKARSVELMYHEYQRLHPDWSVDRVAKAAALHTNDTFGGINWKAMGRSATTQDWGRLMFLAPDWLESEMRSGARLFNKDEGGLGRAQVAKMALGLWGIARVLNLVTTGNAHYEAPFGLATKNKEGKETVFSIRTLPTDLLHAASDPVGFIKGRLSPTVRMGEELVSGRDQFGRKLQPSDLWVDIFRSMTPIPLQAAGQALSGQGPDVGNIGQTVKAVGGTATVYRTPAQKMAADLASDRTESGPVDPASMERHHRIIQLEDQARAGEVSWPDLYKLTYATDQLHPDELKKIETNVKETQGMDPGVAALYSRASRLPAKDYLDLLDVMNNSEKAALAPLTLKTQKKYLNKAKKDETPEERAKDPVFQRFLNMVPGQHPGPISQTAPPIPAPVQQEAAHLYRAINPDTGHRIVHDGSQWRDAETGVAV